MKKAVLALFMAALALTPVFTQNIDIKTAYGALEDLSKEFSKGLTFNSTLGLAWSDAHIGQILNKKPEGLNKPPHFGVGVMAGFTSINKDKVIKALESADLDAGDLDSIPLFPVPAAAGEFRLGGFILPFDVGVKVGVLPSLNLGDFNFKYTFAGFDIRYALIRENPKGVKPSLSVGAGFNYINGTIDGITVGSGTSWDINSSWPGVTNGGTVSLSAPEMGMEWTNMTLDLKAQISKRLIYVFTPYLGLGSSFGWSTVGYGINTTVAYTSSGMGSGGTISDLQTDLNGLGIPFSLDSAGTGLSHEEKNFTYGLRVYGGLAINMWKIILDMTGMYSFLDQNYGASVGLRFQL